ncbi:histidine kinase [Draconibacterium sp. IB214405]|uniref:sensor histidine kinase n=1 Tax=Draconibacterium sp. IB214405 TaxID=3097352 RepID=UPI002A10D583|nr:histidine kinase [Draconibacterium sp. IB214405]MDX8340278.1 histidine kinase [Draconibacterium sp. IB214405]
MNVLKVSAEVKQIDLIYAAVFHLPIVCVVYLNLNLLFPLLWERGNYFSYAGAVLVLTALGSGFYLLLFDNLIDYIFKGYYFIAYYSFWDISLFFAIYLFISSLLHLARGWFRAEELEKEKSQAELKALKSQINPHFLFNSLNSIYSMARKESKEVPDKIVQLSDLMRHIIYESDADFIDLEKEVEMLQNYIDMQNLRSGKSQIVFNIVGEIREKKIAPLLFLPFVENSFKHGMKGGAENAFVKINVEVSGKVLHFEVENSKGKANDPFSAKYHGIGVENVRKRLEMIYPNQHKLKISDNKDTFKVLLQVQLN